MKKITLIIIPIIIVVLISAFLLTRTKKTTTVNPIKTNQTAKQIELTAEEKPYISLIPRADGHELKFKVANIPAKWC
jgi:heme/copper-type cytochrome/quinol oxidase subunit 2